MSLLLVVRHTRAEEEAGRTELVGAAAVGRYAVPVAGFLVAVVANVVDRAAVRGRADRGRAAGGRLVRARPGDRARPGWCSRAVALVTAQVAAVARAASGPAGALLGLAYLLRAVGDSGAVLAVLAVADRLGAAGAGVRRRALVGARAAACC